MDRRTFVKCSGVAAVGLLGGCADSNGGFGDVGQTVSFEALVRQIKYDVGTYLWRNRDTREALRPPGPNATAEEKQTFRDNLATGQYRAARKGEDCVGQVTFTLTRVKLTVSVTVEQKANGSASLEIPVGISTVTPSGSLSSTSNSSLTTTLDIYPTVKDLEKSELVTSEPVPTGEFVGHPITDTLQALRSDLIKTADTKPCFNFGVEQDQKTNSVKLAFVVTQAAGLGGKLKIVFFSLGADGSTSRSVANTVEVFFVSKGEFG
ncbi:hypothetical protein J2X48_000921 [Bosea sp. BE271]|uniref:trypco2 family protein n=1 Tax=Bosea TaxID=85413 RepID=UPI002856FB95|nr:MULTISPECIES: trypco2 family protein [Bosea]MDR6827203.1 hypothetical protein [Bosea robiniae]MDR6893913.1 hypothetical protein [Bosea sp. BE109]MDR7137308.1 hypothetical protein [Bosea sp. BE168]MDR7174008.1 hypothetical protein [Bosea sp. BE271]